MPGLDDQDQSEVFDEDNADAGQTGGVSNEFRTFEEMPDVLDVTTAAGDADAEEFDEDDRALEEGLGADGIEPGADASFADEATTLTATDLGADESSEGEVDLVYAGSLDDLAGAQSSAATWEAGTLADDDIADLGDGPEGADK